ncbi:MAG TPA: Fur family transcriptional regulator [Anaeromyxobacteraceae bacterium]|jgi:Fur family ferric uptake transcriptional regulator|nr:Fur family transcriptional regulator [Anaeromyxobacteraceae bacterium]
MTRQTEERGTGSAQGERRTPAAVLGSFIASRGLKHSRQRDLIVEAFFEMGGHVPVEALVARVRQRDERISIATVYRTMKLLSECGLALPRQFGDGQTRYEPASADTHHHDHLICTGCGAIVEFENDDIEAMQLRIARSYGFEVERHKLELYGRCGECRAQVETAP